MRRKLWRSLARQLAAATWTALAAGALATVVLGAIGFEKNAHAQNVEYPLLTRVYLAVQLFWMNSGGVQGPVSWELETARWFGFLVAVGTILRLIGTVFRDRLRFVWLRTWSDHVVLCGLGRKGHHLAREFLQDGDRVVVIERDQENGHLESFRDQGATVIVADAADPHILRVARAEQARCLIAACADDGTNIRIATYARALAKDRPLRAEEPLECRLHVVDMKLYALLAQGAPWDADDEAKGRIIIRPFDMYTNSARLLFQEHPLHNPRIGPDDPRSVHLVLVGYGQMGRRLLLHAARIGHFANLRKLRVTVIDAQARRAESATLARYPQISQVCDLEFLQVEIEDAEVRTRLGQWAADPVQFLHIAVCFDNDQRAVTCALDLVEVLGSHDTPIYVRVAEQSGFAGLVEAASAGKRPRIYPFGALGRACSRELVMEERLDQLARQIHQRYYDSAIRKGVAAGSTPSARPWDELSENYKNEYRRHADHIVAKLAAIGCRTVRKDQLRGAPVKAFNADEIEMLAKMEHSRWCGERLLAGWQHAPARDDIRRLHPSLVAWEEFSDDDRDKDRDAVRDIPLLLDSIGYAIQRCEESGVASSS